MRLSKNSTLLAVLLLVICAGVLRAQGARSSPSS